jgi:hypothetical protein
MPKTNSKQCFRQERYFAMISYTLQGVNCNNLNCAARCNCKGLNSILTPLVLSGVMQARRAEYKYLHD